MAETVAEYLDALPPDRAAQLKKVRSAIRRELPKGYEEAISGTLITYQVPLATYPDTYNGQPLWLARARGPSRPKAQGPKPKVCSTPIPVVVPRVANVL